MGVSFVLMRQLLHGPWMGAGYQRDQAVLRSLELSIPTEVGGVLEIELMINHDHQLVNDQ